MSAGFALEILDALSEADIREVVALSDRCTEHDGLRPLSEHVWLHLKRGGDERGVHIVARSPEGYVAGYAHLDPTDAVEGSSAEIAVDPRDRRHGLGRHLVEVLIDASPDGRLRLWAHGEQTGATELAASLGFTRSRVLWQMRRSLYAPLPRVAMPTGVEIRPFRVGEDETAWLDLNRRAFAKLPDQGSWELADLDLRLHEPWFSSDGFLMAWRGTRLVGFHWTKVHGAETLSDGHHHPPIGEVYVVGVDPSERGHGLGRALTLAGLHHLRSLDLSQAMLYVDASNLPAIQLYEGLGFARWDTDVLFRR
ncbi:MAG: mycothiol synthase [Actinomycetales bacterium]|nr:mycothiol synthase [Actinomycetales bacterium]